MNASRCTYVAAPDAKAWETLPGCAGQRRRADVIAEGEVSSDIEIAVINEHVIVERVVELSPELQGHAFGQGCLLHDRKINVLVVRTPKDRVDTRTRAGVPVNSRASEAGAGRLKGSDGFECRSIQQRSTIGNVRWAAPLTRVEAVHILQEWVHSRDAADQTTLVKLWHNLAGVGTNPHGSAARVANDRADLPSAY